MLSAEIQPSQKLGTDSKEIPQNFQIFRLCKCQHKSLPYHPHFCLTQFCFKLHHFVCSSIILGFYDEVTHEQNTWIQWWETPWQPHSHVGTSFILGLSGALLYHPVFFLFCFSCFFFLMFFVSLHPTPHHTFKSGNSMDRRTSFEKFAQNVVSFNFLRNYKSLSPVKISLFLAPLPTLHSLTPKVLSLFKPIILLPPYLSPQPFIE